MRVHRFTPISHIAACFLGLMRNATELRAALNSVRAGTRITLALPRDV